VNNINVIAFTHKNLEVNNIGLLHIGDDQLSERLNALKTNLALDEIMFLSTCNRVEFVLVTQDFVDKSFIQNFLSTLYSDFEAELLHHFVNVAQHFEGTEAVTHMLRVATSIDSMVVGEREIITQVRSAFENCRALGLTGDTIRILMRHTIETAKKVYTHTAIATNPVSIVSLAYNKLRDTAFPLDSRILIVGAGSTNTTFSKFLLKHGFTNFTIYNRSIQNAEKLAIEVGGNAFPLAELANHKNGL